MRDGSQLAASRDEEIQPDGVFPKPPVQIKGEALKEWTRIRVKHEAQRTIDSNLDYSSLVAISELWGRRCELSKLVDKRKPGSPSRKRIAVELKEVHNQWFAMSKDFGMRMANRTRVKIPAKKTQSKAQKFFSQPAVIGKIG